jgi:glutamate carboxypeptidase
MTQNIDPKKAREYFDGRVPAMIDAIRGIVDIESPSGDEAGNAAVVEWIEKYLFDTGVSVSVEKIDAGANGKHLVIEAFGNEKPHTFLIGHTDTVHPIGTNKQNPTRVEGERLYGCGIFDMKANIVAMFEAMRFFSDNDLRPARPIRILLSCDEEIGSPSGREYVESGAKDAVFCLVCEPSAAGKIKTGRKGTGMYSVSAHGVPAHAGLEPEKGANAVLELSRHIEPITALTDADKGTTVNVCTFSGGTAMNVIPEFAKFSIDFRFKTAAEAERVDAALRALKPFDERVSIEINGGINRPPMERTDAVAELFAKARTAAESFGYAVDETQVGGASDGNFAAALGVPVLDGLGIRGDGAHTLDEYIDISDIADRTTLLTLLLSV